MLRWKRPHHGRWEAGPFWVIKSDGHWEAYCTIDNQLPPPTWYKTLGEAKRVCDDTPYGLAQELRWHLLFGVDEDVATFISQHQKQILKVLEGPQ